MRWEGSARAYCLLPDGSYFVQEAMGGHPRQFHAPVQHPGLASLRPLNPLATHVRFVRTPFYTTRHPCLFEGEDERDRTHLDDPPGFVLVGLRVYTFSAAVRQVGPQINEEWETVPLHAEETTPV